MESKRKILFLSDHCLIPSGVGNQAKLLIEGLLATGKYKFYCFGAALDHQSYDVQKVDPQKYGDDWIIQPTKGHGDKNTLRAVIAREKPDAIFIFTDPRFFIWLWEMEDEIHQICPILYWHVWDNDPTPDFNKIFYDSTDFVSALSLKTYGLLDSLGCKNFNYIPHALPPDVFFPLPEDEVQKFKKEKMGPHGEKKFVLFWNNRNARRKQTGDVIATFAQFSKKVGKDNVALMMHTAVHDREGQDIMALARKFDIENQLIISENRINTSDLNMFYNVSDLTINLASNEGFGLGTLESLYAGTPIIVHMTGGLQFQIGDWWRDLKKFDNQEAMTAIAKKAWSMKQGKWWGVPLFSASRSCTGSQEIPYIYDDRICHEDAVDALVKMYEFGRVARKKLGLEAREWALKNFDLKKTIADWDRTIQEQVNKFKAAGHKNVRFKTI